MENHIFYCYEEWLKDEDGNLFKQIFKIPVIARILLGLLLLGLIIFFVILGCTVSGYNTTAPILIWGVLYFILCIITTIYTEKYQIENSKSSLENYNEYCNRMMDNVFKKNKISEKIIPTLIERFNMTVEEINNKVKLKHEKLNKFMEVLLIPVSVLILGALLDKGTNATQTLGFGLSGILIILFIYAVIFIVLFIYDIVVKFPLVKYKQFITDMQSILDFKEYKSSNESSDSLISSPLTETESESTNVHS